MVMPNHQYGVGATSGDAGVYSARDATDAVPGWLATADPRVDADTDSTSNPYAHAAQLARVASRPGVYRRADRALPGWRIPRTLVDPE